MFLCSAAGEFLVESRVFSLAGIRRRAGSDRGDLAVNFADACHFLAN